MTTAVDKWPAAACDSGRSRRRATYPQLLHHSLGHNLLSELGNVRERFQTEDQLAAEAGVAPVTHASGKSRGVVFRWACNKNLRVAITCFADNSRHASGWASEHAREGANIYTRARDRGCKHAHAVRILARAWIRVLWRTWQDGEAYNPAKHKAAVRMV